MRRASSLVGGLGLFRGDDLDQSAVSELIADIFCVNWEPISTASYNGDLELAVIGKDGPRPIRRKW